MKRNELQFKFDLNTQRLNLKLTQNTSRISKYLKQIEDNQNSIRRAFINGVKNVHLLICEDISKTYSKLDYNRYDDSRENSNVFSIWLDNTPLSWLSKPKEEAFYDETVEKIERTIKDRESDKINRDFMTNLEDFKHTMDYLMIMKVEIYITDLLEKILNQEERSSLEIIIISALRESQVANYFLAYINYKL